MLYVALNGRVDDAKREGFRIVGLPIDVHGDLTGWGWMWSVVWLSRKKYMPDPQLSLFHLMATSTLRMPITVQFFALRSLQMKI